MVQLEKILASGAILPNEGGFPDTYPQSAISYGRRRRLISLWDFQSCSAHKAIEHMPKWREFFTRHQPVTIAIILDRQSIVDQLIPNVRAVVEVGYVTAEVFIPRVEAWHPGPIPLSAVVGYIVFCGVNDGCYTVEPPGDDIMDRIGRISASFQTDHAAAYRRHEAIQIFAAAAAVASDEEIIAMLASVKRSDANCD
jgi:hypothetical protein